LYIGRDALTKKKRGNDGLKDGGFTKEQNKGTNTAKNLRKKKGIEGGRKRMKAEPTKRKTR